MKKIIILLAILALSQGGDKATVTRIIDGDTIEATYQGQKETIRLIGIDTPESKLNRKAKRDAKRTGQTIQAITAQGKQAARFTETLIKKGDPIIIKFNKRKRDRYGRLLAYVYLPSGEMLNEELIKHGHAVIMTISPNVRHRQLFNRAYRNRVTKSGEVSPEPSLVFLRLFACFLNFFQKTFHINNFYSMKLFYIS